MRKEGGREQETPLPSFFFQFSFLFPIANSVSLYLFLPCKQVLNNVKLQNLKSDKNRQTIKLKVAGSLFFLGIVYGLNVYCPFIFFQIRQCHI